MCPATAAPDARQVAISLAAVCFKVAPEFPQEFHGIEPCPGLRVVIKDDHRQPVFPVAEEPHIM